MKRTPYSLRTVISVISLMLFITLLIIGVVLYSKSSERWITFLLIGISIVFFINALVFIPKTNRDGSPIKIEKKKKKHKNKKHKKPFINDSEWKELEDEDDEMEFIDQIVEDD